jgi:predicted nuclease of restriction endonuclease-like (RecB) superfamily
VKAELSEARDRSDTEREIDDVSDLTLARGWSIRQLDRQIARQFFERIALSQNKAAMLEKVENASPRPASYPAWMQ